MRSFDSRLLLVSLLLLHACGVVESKKSKKAKGKTKVQAVSPEEAARQFAEKTESRPFTQKHPQQPKFEQINEEDIPPGTEVKKIKEGEVLNLAENAEKEAARKFPDEVNHMFDAVMTDEFASINKVLKDEKVPVNVRGPNGYTPLFQAVFSHKINAVHMLLEAGADPRLRNNQGFNALDAAAYGGCVQCVQMLLKHRAVSPFLIGRDGYNALHRAIWGDDPEHTETVELLLEAGLSPSKPAVVPGQGTLAPIDMVNENEGTAKLLKRWLTKEKKQKSEKAQKQKSRAAESAKADQLFGAVGKKTTDEGLPAETKKDEL